MTLPERGPEAAPAPAADGAAEEAAARRERRARLTWSLLAEPSDTAAHSLCSEFGAEGGLEVLETRSLDALLHALQKRPLRDPSDPAARQGDAPKTARAALLRWQQRRDAVDVEEVLDLAQGQGMRVLVPGDEEWPDSLADLGEQAPFCLWAHGPGDPAALSGEQAVAIVGSRASTPYGDDCAGSFAAQLAGQGVPILSGGAYGIDAAAHRGALAAGGPTLAILAGGLDSLYPRGNDTLLRAIRARHVLISEAPPGTAPTRWRFLARNRLIAALARVTVVVEAAWRSGALSTARRAEALGRTVAAVPGPISSAASAGCHRLIREEGAVLVTESQEIRELLPRAAPAVGSRHAVQDELDILEPADRRVLDAVPPRSATTPQRIAGEIGWSDQEVLAALGRLDMMGVLRVDAERVRRR